MHHPTTPVITAEAWLAVGRAVMKQMDTTISSTNISNKSSNNAENNNNYYLTTLFDDY